MVYILKVRSTFRDTLLRGDKLLPRTVYIRCYTIYTYTYVRKRTYSTVCLRLTGRESWLTLFTFLKDDQPYIRRRSLLGMCIARFACYCRLRLLNMQQQMQIKMQMCFKVTN